MRRGYNQAGIVSIMVVTVLIVLISLVTIGFSRLMNRETRQALDRQLGLQSYYAAESGINDAVNYLDGIMQTRDVTTADSITKCSDNKLKGFRPNLSGETTPNAQYSCVLIDATPLSLIYAIKAGQSRVFSFNQEQLTKLLVSWQNSSDTTANNYRSTGSRDFPNFTAWNNTAGQPGATGALEVSIYPVMLRPGSDPNNLNPQNDWLDRRDLTAKYARTFFLYPNKAASAGASLTPVDYYSNNGAIITGQCDDSHTTTGGINFPGSPSSQVYHCDSILNCFPNAVTGSGGSGGCPGRGSEYRAQHYYVKITSLYADSSVMLRGADQVNIQTTLRGAQAVVDSTGKGNDVLRRINAHISIGPNGNGVIGSDLVGPNFGLRSVATICKRIRQTVDGRAIVDGDGDPACDLDTSGPP